MFDPFIFNSYVESGTIVKHYFLQDIQGSSKIYDRKIEQYFDIGPRIDRFFASTSFFKNDY